MEPAPSKTSVKQSVSTSKDERRIQFVAERNQKLHELEQSSKLVGLKVAELEALIGQPTHLQNNGRTLIYRLDSGLGGIEWAFEIQNEKIFKATKQDLD
jgi:hypothetical protein